MTTAAWIFMSVVWSVIIVTCGVTLKKILK